MLPAQCWLLNALHGWLQTAESIRTAYEEWQVWVEKALQQPPQEEDKGQDGKEAKEPQEAKDAKQHEKPQFRLLELKPILLDFNKTWG